MRRRRWRRSRAALPLTTARTGARPRFVTLGHIPRPAARRQVSAVQRRVRVLAAAAGALGVATVRATARTPARGLLTAPERVARIAVDAELLVPLDLLK